MLGTFATGWLINVGTLSFHFPKKGSEAEFEGLINGFFEVSNLRNRKINSFFHCLVVGEQTISCKAMTTFLEIEIARY